MDCDISKLVSDHAPVARLLPCVLPHINQKVDMYGSFRCATDVSSGASTSDGLFLCPALNEFCRCILCPENSTRSTLANLRAFEQNFTQGFATLRAIVDMMIPVSGQSLILTPDISLFPMGRCVSGIHTIVANTSSSTTAAMSGDLGASWCDTTTNNYGFSRSTIAQRASYPKDKEMSVRADDGLTLSIPPIAWPFSYTGKRVTIPGGVLISTSTASNNPINVYFVSHVMACTDAAVSNVRIGNIPWGARPTIEFDYPTRLPANASPQAPFCVRFTHCYATWIGSSWTISIFRQSSVMMAPPSSCTTTVPPISTGDIQSGVWIGTFVIPDTINLGAPTVNTYLDSRQMLLNYAHVARLDNLSSGAQFVVASSLFYELTKNATSASILANENLTQASGQMDIQVAAMSQFMNANGSFSAVQKQDV